MNSMPHISGETGALLLLVSGIILVRVSEAVIMKLDKPAPGAKPLADPEEGTNNYAA